MICCFATRQCTQPRSTTRKENAQKKAGQVQLSVILVNRRLAIALMPRQACKAPGGLIYHVLNRGVGRMKLFRHEKDYVAFLRCFRDVLDDSPMVVLAY